MESVAERVDRGMRLLDEHFGPEWVDRIDLGTFDLSDCFHCVLGQIFGSFRRGVKVLRLDWSAPLGFNNMSGRHYDEYRALATEWTRRILERRKTAVPSVTRPVPEREPVLA